MSGVLGAAALERMRRRGDALGRAGRLLPAGEAARIERKAASEVRGALARALTHLELSLESDGG